MTKWGKFFLIGTILWQIPCLFWIFYYQKPNTNLIMGMPSAVFTFAGMYLFYSIFFGGYVASKYLTNPTGKGISIRKTNEGGGK